MHDPGKGCTVINIIFQEEIKLSFGKITGISLSGSEINKHGCEKSWDTGSVLKKLMRIISLFKFAEK